MKWLRNIVPAVLLINSQLRITCSLDCGMPRKECGSLDDDAGLLDHSSLCIQGLRGCGKTYTVARMVTALLQAGKRVGIMSLTARMAPAIAMLAGRGCLEA